MAEDTEEAVKVDRGEFEELRRQVHTLERRVEAQQDQIATLRRRTTTDAGSSPPEESVEGNANVSRSPVEREVLAILEHESKSGPSIEVDTIKQQAAENGHLRSTAKNVVRNWLNQGYLSGDLDEMVKVVEWPPKDNTE